MIPNTIGLPPWPGDTYPHELRLHRKLRDADGTALQDDEGAPIGGWEDEPELIMGDVQPGTVRREEPDGTVREVVGVMILTEVNPRCREGDQFRVTDPSTGDERKYQVLGGATDEGFIQDGWTTSTTEVTG